MLNALLSKIKYELDSAQSTICDSFNNESLIYILESANTSKGGHLQALICKEAVLVLIFHFLIIISVQRNFDWCNQGLRHWQSVLFFYYNEGSLHWSFLHNYFIISKRIEHFHMTSRWPYWRSKTMKRRRRSCSKKILWELNSFLM